MSDIDAQFKAFLKLHPEVLVDLEHNAVRLLEVGARRIGIKSLWEALRVEYAMQGRPTRLSNNLTSRFARLMIERDPRLRSVIETRPLRSERTLTDEQARDAYLDELLGVSDADFAASSDEPEFSDETNEEDAA